MVVLVKSETSLKLGQVLSMRLEYIRWAT